MNFESVRSIIDTYIKKNGVEAITGDILNNVLNTMLDDVDTAISSIEPSPGGGGGGTADLSNYYTKAESDNRYLASSLLGSNTLIHSGNIGSYAPTYDASKNVTIDNQLWVKSYLNINRNGSTGALYDASRMGIEIEPFASYVVLKGYNTSGTGVGGIFLNSSGNVTLGGRDLAGTSTRLSVDGSFTMWGAYQNEMPTLGDFTNARFKLYGYGNRTTQNWGLFAAAMNSGDVYLQAGGDFGDTLAYDLLFNPLGGNVGIGTDSPSYKLDVNGDISAMSALRIGGCGTSYCGLYPNNQITSGGDSSKLWLYNDGGLVLYGTTLEIYPTTILYDKLGVGISSPTCALDVNGGIKATQPIFGYMYGTNNNAAAFIFDKPGLNYTGIGSDGVSDTIRLGACNADGTWVDGYAQKWKFYGDVIVSGDFSFGSDIRFKDVIKNKTLKIEHIAKAPLFTYKWNDRDDDTIYLGSSAQYWEKIAPWLVSGDDFKSLNYATLGVAMGISLAKKTINHEERIKILEAEIKRLKREQYGS